MKFNRQAYYGSDKPELNWAGTAPKIYDTEDVLYELTTGCGIENEISSLRRLVAAVLEVLPEDKVLVIIDKINGGPDFVRAT